MGRATLAGAVIGVALLAGCSSGAVSAVPTTPSATTTLRSAPASTSPAKTTSAISTSTMSKSSTPSHKAAVTTVAPSRTTQPAPSPTATARKNKTCYYVEGEGSYQCTASQRSENLRMLQQYNRANGGVTRAQCTNGSLQASMYAAECTQTYGAFRGAPKVKLDANGFALGGPPVPYGPSDFDHPSASECRTYLEQVIAWSEYQNANRPADYNKLPFSSQIQYLYTNCKLKYPL